jgi:hypothetical protein
MSRPAKASAYWPVVSAPSSVPTASTTSASPSSAWKAGSSQDEPALSGCAAGNAALPMYVVATGARTRSASTASSSHAPERSTPPPAQITGRSAAASRRAAAATASGWAARGGGGAPSSASGTGTDVSSCSTSTGISR